MGLCWTLVKVFLFMTRTTMLILLRAVFTDMLTGRHFVVLTLNNKSKRFSTSAYREGAAVWAAVVRSGSQREKAMAYYFGMDLECIGCVCSDNGKVLVCDPKPTHDFGYTV